MSLSSVWWIVATLAERDKSLALLQGDGIRSLAWNSEWPHSETSCPMRSFRV
jgi:hypothetical protein